METNKIDKKKIKGQKTGLVLGSGAARGFSQIGVIKALVEKDIFIDIIVGTSVGAIVAACYAKLVDKKDFKGTMTGDGWSRIFQIANLDLDAMFRGFADEKKITEWLKTAIGDISFDQLALPMAVVAADAQTGEEVVIKEGSVLKALKASISVPVLFPPVKYGDRYLVDGAFANPVAVEVAKDMGATYIIACDTTRTREEKKVTDVKEKLLKGIDQQNKKFMRNAVGMKKTLKKFVNTKLVNTATVNAFERRRNIDRNILRMFRALKQTLNNIEAEVVKSQLLQADLVITPNVGHIDMMAFSKGKEAVIEGYNAATKALSKL
ncbi:MAG: patatin-like phospholipase family protein [Candidatus Omnitrophota bacterium]